MLTRKATSTVIVLLMILGGLFMWAGNPILWIWLTAKSATSQSLSLPQVLFILTAIGITGFIMVNILAWLNEAHQRVNGQKSNGPERMTWTQSLSSGRTSGRPVTMLDKIMVGCVLVAGFLAVIWFFLFADDTLHHGQNRTAIELVVQKLST